MYGVENETVTVESFASACFHVFHQISIYSFPASAVPMLTGLQPCISVEISQILNALFFLRFFPPSLSPS